ncbi:MAG: Xaa-Pro peptidase family protein [Actinomycetota bacterium]|nr:Xaa-Pro peptidase family protein [Actinomycetota bacterium]
MDHGRRLASAVGLLDAEEVDALLVTDPVNVRYLTGFTGTNGQVLVTRSGATFLTDARYEAQAGVVVRDATIVVYPQRLGDALGPLLESLHVRRLGIEAEHVSIATAKRLAKSIDGIESIPTTGVIEGLRRGKESDEINLLREAVRLGDEVFMKALDHIAPGSSTERDVALYIEIEFRRSGAESVSFPPIVASGPLSAHVHHTASERVIEKGDLVVLDLGCRLHGYCSDLTRTVAVGPASRAQLELHEVVLRAQKRAIAQIRPGASGKAVDRTAREIIGSARLSGDFKHGLGHGVGLDVHEAPRLHRLSDDVLAGGEVVTVEPGVYETGAEGLRIEDMVVVGDGTAEVLTSAPKEELIEL